MKPSASLWRWLSEILFVTSIIGLSAILAAAFGVGGLNAEDGPALAVVAFAKWIALAIGAMAAVVCARRLEGRASWRLMATGLCLYVAGQSTLAYYQVIRHQPMPFPSWADLFFIAGMVSIAASLVFFLFELVGSGFPLDLGRGLIEATITVLAFGGLAAWILLSPILPLGLDSKSLLSLVYPLAELVLMVPLVFLHRVTWRFRGGQIWRVWMTLLGGVALMLLGDLSFALYLDRPSAALGAGVDICYLLGYVLAARACLTQWLMIDPVS